MKVTVHTKSGMTNFFSEGIPIEIDIDIDGQKFCLTEDHGRLTVMGAEPFISTLRVTPRSGNVIDIQAVQE